MSKQFKQGDKVVCVNSGGWHLTVGKEYTVQSSNHEYCRIINDLGQLGGYYHSSFEPVNKEPALYSVRVKGDAAALLWLRGDTADEVKEKLRRTGKAGMQYEILEVRVVGTVEVERVIKEVQQ